MNQYVNFTDKDHSQSFEIALEEIVRAGARKMLQQALENEVDEFLARCSTIKTEGDQPSHRQKWPSPGKSRPNRCRAITHQTTTGLR